MGTRYTEKKRAYYSSPLSDHRINPGNCASQFSLHSWCVHKEMICARVCCSILPPSGTSFQSVDTYTFSSKGKSSSEKQRSYHKMCVPLLCNCLCGQPPGMACVQGILEESPRCRYQQEMTSVMTQSRGHLGQVCNVVMTLDERHRLRKSSLRRRTRC